MGFRVEVNGTVIGIAEEDFGIDQMDTADGGSIEVHEFLGVTIPDNGALAHGYYDCFLIGPRSVRAYRTMTTEAETFCPIDLSRSVHPHEVDALLLQLEA
jgi:hypothetical protein